MCVSRKRPEDQEELIALKINRCKLQMQVLGEQHVNLEAERINLDLTKQLLMAQMQEKA